MSEKKPSPQSTASEPQARLSEQQSISRSRRNPKKLSKFGDIAPDLSENGIANFEVAESIDAAQESKISAVKDIIENTPPHDDS